MNGILLVDKPIGWTSHDVVAKIRSLLKTQTGQKIKVGHTGTLDPAASGLMILVIGDYTKRAGEFSKMDKSYDVEIVLGKLSSSGDSEGDITSGKDHRPDRRQVEAVLDGFKGSILQKPPAFSAIKVKGQRAYKLARAGKSVELEPRPVTIYALEGMSYKYPKLSFTAKVSTGTYIRSLAMDIGDKLGTGAYLASLRRTMVGEFDLKQAASLSDLTKGDISRRIYVNGEIG